MTPDDTSNIDRANRFARDMFAIVDGGCVALTSGPLMRVEGKFPGTYVEVPSHPPTISPVEWHYIARALHARGWVVEADDTGINTPEFRVTFDYTTLCFVLSEWNGAGR